MINRVLVANRGEIAVRIIRAANSLNISTVAVYSDVDRFALHVKIADQAISLGSAEPGESYLNIEKLISAAKDTNCDAVHPGYGFLAERASFARAVIEAGLTWIGPPPEAIDLLGDKIASRDLMKNAGVPVTPGFASDTSDIEVYRREADKIGYPLLVKAAAGGGGKGMRVVHQGDDLKAAIEGAMREAEGAFGDGRIFLEKFLERPRHIEFQIFADEHGNVIHIFERECSIQRRHQKVVEETPSTALTPDLREKMGEAAVATAKAANYVNAGTVEFLLDTDNSFYFLEVNTRIQVEHPITEEVAGVDLVAEQFRIASGEPLSWKQENLHQRGHAIEARIYAEDPAKGFLPAAGSMLYLSEPHGPGIRIDSGVLEGVDVPINYDPIMAKVITWGETREAAISRMVEALRNYTVLGIPTTAPFLRDVIGSKPFREGETFTDFIDLHFKDWVMGNKENEELAMGLAAVLAENSPGSINENLKIGIPTPWKTLGGWRMGDRK